MRQQIRVDFDSPRASRVPVDPSNRGAFRQSGRARQPPRAGQAAGERSLGVMAVFGGRVRTRRRNEGARPPLGRRAVIQSAGRPVRAPGNRVPNAAQVAQRDGFIYSPVAAGPICQGAPVERHLSATSSSPGESFD